MPDYFVLNDAMKNPAGHRIFTDPQGRKRISLTPAAAQYWIDQGAISDRPLGAHSAHGRSILAGMTGQMAPDPNAPQPEPEPKAAPKGAEPHHRRR